MKKAGEKQAINRHFAGHQQAEKPRLHLRTGDYQEFYSGIISCTF